MHLSMELDETCYLLVNEGSLQLQACSLIKLPSSECMIVPSYLEWALQVCPELPVAIAEPILVETAAALEHLSCHGPPFAQNTSDAPGSYSAEELAQACIVCLALGSGALSELIPLVAQLSSAWAVNQMGAINKITPMLRPSMLRNAAITQPGEGRFDGPVPEHAK